MFLTHAALFAHLAPFLLPSLLCPVPCTAADGSARKATSLQDQPRRRSAQDSHPDTVDPTDPSGLPGAPAVLSAERKCKAKARWEFQKTAPHTSSGTFMFHEASFSPFLTEARGFPARMSSSIRGMKPQAVRERGRVLTWVPHHNLLFVFPQHSGRWLACLRFLREYVSSSIKNHICLV